MFVEYTSCNDRFSEIYLAYVQDGPFMFIHLAVMMWFDLLLSRLYEVLPPQQQKGLVLSPRQTSNV